MLHKTCIVVSLTLASLLSTNLAARHTEVIKSPDCPREKIDIQISQKCVFSGEILWFKIYCSSILFPGEELSNLAFIEIVNGKNASVLRKKILLRNGEGGGEFEIPDSLQTGIYYVSGYTNWMKNFGEGSFFREELIIINPYQSIRIELDSMSSEGSLDETSTPAVSDVRLKVKPGKTKYSTREKVSVTIETFSSSGEPIPGNFSVSVYRMEPGMIFRTSERQEKKVTEVSDKITYLPDFRGILLSGKLMYHSDDAAVGALVTVSTPGRGTDIESDITDSCGRFHFLLEPQEGEREIVITFPDKDMKISLEEPFWNGPGNVSDNVILRLSPEAVSFLRDRHAYSRFQARFGRQSSIKKTTDENLPDTNVFYVKPLQTVRLSDYISLDSLREYFYELIPAVKFVKRRGELNILVIDPLTSTYFEEKPGLFLDGILYDNYSAIAEIPVGEIDRIEVLPSVYYYKDFLFGGIIDIHTKKSDFSSVKTLPNMTRFIYPMADESEWQFLSPDHSHDDAPENIPDFRYCLYWDPGVKVNGQGAASVQFYTGDVKGRFVVEVVGITAGGDILHSETEIYIDD